LLNKPGTYQQAGDQSDAALLSKELIKKKTTKLGFGEVADNEEKGLLY
jgi:hypothetical protein